MKTKKAGFATKIVILVLLVAAALSLLAVQSKLKNAQAAKSDMQQMVDNQTTTNQSLQEDINNADDPDTIKDVARDKLGLVEPGEKIFIEDTN